MTNVNEKDARELESSIPDKSVEESNVDDTHKCVPESKPNEGKRNPQPFVSKIDWDKIHASNITPETFKQRKAYLWEAVRQAIYIADTRADVFILVAEWNRNNKPRIPGKQLIREIRSTLNEWRNKFQYDSP